MITERKIRNGAVALDISQITDVNDAWKVHADMDDDVTDTAAMNHSSESSMTIGDDLKQRKRQKAGHCMTNVC